MATMLRQARLEQTSTALCEAIDQAGIKRTALAALLKVSPATIANMSHAKSPVGARAARILGKELGIDPATITSPPKPSGVEKRGGKRKGAGKAGKVDMGPAQRAMILHESEKPPAATPPLLPRPTPVLGMEALSDGTASVWCKVSLPADRAAALFRLLLDFGLTGQGGT